MIDIKEINIFHIRILRLVHKCYEHTGHIFLPSINCNMYEAYLASYVLAATATKNA